MSKSVVILCMLASVLLPACHGNDSANSLSNDVAPSIAYTAEVPSSKFDPWLVGKNRRDVSDAFYRELSFLPANLRFIAVYDPAVEPAIGSAFLNAYPSSIFLVVLPHNEVVKFMEAADVPNVGVRIRSPQHALALVRFLSSYGEMGRILEATPYFRLKFGGSELLEIPTGEGYSAFTPESLKTAGITPPVVEAGTHAKREEKYFVVTRFMIPVPASRRAFDNGLPIPKVVKVKERVSTDGRYSMEGELIDTPGLIFHAMKTL